MHDVIVIGGGPVGSHIAYRLAASGHSVAVLERRQELGKKGCCTGIISRECADSFAVDNSAVLRAVNSASLFSPSGHRLRLHREPTQAFVLDRAVFDTAIATRARGKGAEYVLGCRANNIAVEDNKATVRASRQGRDIGFEGRAVVIAAGFAPGLTGRSGLGQPGDFALGVQAEVETAEADEVEVYFGQETAPSFFAWLVPTSPRTARVGLLSRRSPGTYLRKLMDSLLAQGKIVSAGTQLHYGVVPLKPPPRTHGERLIAVGDAAGQVKPTSGGGIYYGLLCADIAADTLHRALEAGDLSARMLAAYERQWQKRLGQELKIDYWARRLFERMSDKQIDRAFGLVKAGGIDEALLGDSSLSFDWHSKAILKLMGYRALSRAMGAMRIPLNISRGVRPGGREH